MIKKVIFWIIFLSACSSGVNGYRSSEVEDLKIIANAQAAKLQGYKTQAFVADFDPSQDGTKIIIDYLKQSKEQGADYVSDLELKLTTANLTCRSKILPKEEIKSESYTKQSFGSYERKVVPKLVTKNVTENEYHCQMVPKTVQRSETYYEQRYDYYTKSYRSSPQTRYVSRTEYQNECQSRLVSKLVTRYEYQYETNYIPPKTEYLTRTYSDWNLEETVPVCENTKEAKQSLTVSGILYLE